MGEMGQGSEERQFRVQSLFTIKAPGNNGIPAYNRAIKHHNQYTLQPKPQTVSESIHGNFALKQMPIRIEQGSSNKMLQNDVQEASQKALPSISTTNSYLKLDSQFAKLSATSAPNHFKPKIAPGISRRPGRSSLVPQQLYRRSWGGWRRCRVALAAMPNSDASAPEDKSIKGYSGQMKNSFNGGS